MDSLQTGVVITKVADNSAAARIGLQAGDFIVKVNGADVGNVNEAKAELEKNAPRWQIGVRRAGRLMTVTIEG
jgi:S1-C subfamily serine protease